jgi:hypothetical protein
VADERINDWANLPDDVESVSIWHSVHDGDVRAFNSDRRARTLTIEFAVPYLLSFHHLSENLTFTFAFAGVQSVRAMRLAVWPVKFELPTGLPSEEQEKLRSEYFAKSREESASWDKFEGDVTSDDEAEFTTGELALAPNGAVAARLGVQMGSGEWYEVFVRAQSLTVMRSDQQSLTLSQFTELGNAYWEAFAARRNSPQR